MMFFQCVELFEYCCPFDWLCEGCYISGEWYLWCILCEVGSFCLCSWLELSNIDLKIFYVSTSKQNLLILMVLLFEYYCHCPFDWFC